MNMDYTVDVKYRLAMAKALYMGLRGLEVDQETSELASSYSKELFISPWRDPTDYRTQAYGIRFFDALKTMGNTTKMIERWQRHFDEDNLPHSPDLARAFISDFFRIHLHYPRDYHDFVCQRRDITQSGVLDFPVEHPISVEFWAIYITISGSATLNVGNESLSLGPNSIAIIAPGCDCTLTRSDHAEHWTYDWLSFRSRMDWIELLGWATALTKPVSFNIDDPDSFACLTQQTERLESTTYTPDTLSERLCNNIIENILLSIRIFAEDVTNGGPQTNRKVQGAVDYILNHYGDEISLEMISASVNSSPGRLSTLFREQFGVSVIKWRDQIRMQKAKELIKHSNDTIGSIANRVGYPDALYFSRRFKDHFGIAPSEFRSNQQRGNSFGSLIPGAKLKHAAKRR